MITYSYGALAPTKGLELLIEQLRLASRYRNALIELELWRRAAGDYADKATVKPLFLAEQRVLRGASGLGWGTYQLVEQDVQRASKTRSPRFRSYDGTGRVGAAVQAGSGLSSENLSAGAVQLSERAGKAICRLRVTAGGWLELPVKIHRELPLAQIVRAAVTVNRVGTRWVYSVQFVMRSDAPNRVTGSGQCAINFGWRRVPGGVRVAYAVGEHGEHELVLPDSLIGRFKHAESLRGIADSHAVEHLGDARRRARARRESLDARPVCAARRELGQVPLTPASSREHWARRDRHLYQWECDERASALRARKEVYRIWVRSLAAVYGEARIEDFDLRRVIGRDCPIEIPQSRHVRFLVAPSRIREEVKSVFGNRAKLVRQKDLTATCNECGHLCEFDQARELAHTCERCGASWDQDANNAANQLMVDHTEAAE